MGLSQNQGKKSRCPHAGQILPKLAAPHKRLSRYGLCQCATDIQISLAGFEKGAGIAQSV